MADADRDKRAFAGHDQVDPMRWLKRSLAFGAVVIGWIFIAWQNHFHATPPVVFACLAYFALVATIYNLWRTGAAAVSGDAEIDDSTWGKPVGVIGVLEREKRTLLKAIKEAEFDQQMGKLSKVDAEQMIGVYRARAIEVIKEIEKLETGGQVGTKREQIEREVRARLELDKGQERGGKKADRWKAKDGTKPRSAEADDEDSEIDSTVASTAATSATDALAKSEAASAQLDAELARTNTDAAGPTAEPTPTTPPLVTVPASTDADDSAKNEVTT
ncbi:MAG: hypothetical protein NT062_16010 [Proteobacteria bacterium]|nr:hypothetical protein [Pseudomonadota bacterium]